MTAAAFKGWLSDWLASLRSKGQPGRGQRRNGNQFLNSGMASEYAKPADALSAVACP